MYTMNINSDGQESVFYRQESAWESDIFTAEEIAMLDYPDCFAAPHMQDAYINALILGSDDPIVLCEEQKGLFYGNEFSEETESSSNNNKRFFDEISDTKEPHDSEELHDSDTVHRNKKARVTYEVEYVESPAPQVSNKRGFDDISSEEEGQDEFESFHRSKKPRTSPPAPQEDEVGETEARPTDVICGRGRLAAKHPGNQHFRKVIAENRVEYLAIETRKGGKKRLAKTAMTKRIVDDLLASGVRFVFKVNDRYHVLSKAEAQRKTSQALREGLSVKTQSFRPERMYVQEKKDILASAGASSDKISTTVAATTEPLHLVTPPASPIPTCNVVKPISGVDDVFSSVPTFTELDLAHIFDDENVFEVTGPMDANGIAFPAAW